MGRLQVVVPLGPDAPAPVGGAAVVGVPSPPPGSGTTTVVVSSR
jgi:hypothetical protein